MHSYLYLVHRKLYRCRAGLCVVALMVLVFNSMAFAADPATPTKAAGELLQGLPEGSGLFSDLVKSPALKWLANLAITTGMVFLLWGHSARTENKRGDEMFKEQMRTWITLVAMLVCPFMLGRLASLADDALSETVRSPVQVAAQIALACDIMPDPVNVLANNAINLIDSYSGAQAGDPAAPAKEGGSWLSRTWGSIKDVGSSLVGLIPAFLSALYAWAAEQIKMVLFVIFILVMKILMLVSQLALWFYEQIRFLILVLGGAFLPMFVSAFALEDGHWFKESGKKYTLKMMVVALWPLAWIVFGMITPAFLTAWVKTMLGAGVLNSAKQGEAILGKGLDALSAGDLVNTAAQADQFITNAGAAALTPILALFVGTAFMVLWLVLAPWKLTSWFEGMMMAGGEAVFKEGAAMVGQAVKTGATVAGGAVGGSAAALSQGGGSSLAQSAMSRMGGANKVAAALGHAGEAVGSLGSAISSAAGGKSGSAQASAGKGVSGAYSAYRSMRGVGPQRPPGT